MNSCVHSLGEGGGGGFNLSLLFHRLFLPTGFDQTFNCSKVSEIYGSFNKLKTKLTFLFLPSIQLYPVQHLPK